MTNQPEAVVALYRAVHGDAPGEPPYTPNQLHDMKIYVERLNTMGFTITRAAPAAPVEVDAELSEIALGLSDLDACYTADSGFKVYVERLNKLITQGYTLRRGSKCGCCGGGGLVTEYVENIPACQADCHVCNGTGFLRRETMTEAELEREIDVLLANNFSDEWRMSNGHFKAQVTGIAKKFRGME